MNEGDLQSGHPWALMIGVWPGVLPLLRESRDGVGEVSVFRSLNWRFEVNEC